MHPSQATESAADYPSQHSNLQRVWSACIIVATASHCPLKRRTDRLCESLWGKEPPMFDTYIGTTSGVYHLHDGAVEPLGLASERVWAIHAWRDDGALTILAGSYGNGLYRGEDGGTWSPANAGL